ncbi:hypothetical protein Tco_0955102 [Tanacetum coccineum]|uniref:Uncharacterized protein n=1 Tax=Tanacetum coccineum TaxID=301880 RepID=A0ABQ5E6A3_9ASTR
MVQPAKTTIVEGVVTVMPITTAEEKAQRRLERNLQQIHPDDNEETDLRCKSHVDYRVKRLLKNTGRKLTVNGNETMSSKKSRQQEQGKLKKDGAYGNNYFHNFGVIDGLGG